jgi:type II secretory pathway component PulJ
MLEMVIATGMLALVMGAVAALLQNIQKGRISQLDVAEMQQNQRYAMDCILQRVAGAGNDLQGIGVTAFDMDPLGNGQHSAVRIRSDFNPPDGVTTDPLENVLFSLSGNTLTMQDAASGSTTEVAQNISSVLYEFFDASGSPAATSASVARVRVTLTGTSTHHDPNSGQFRTFALTDESAVRSCAALGGSIGSP